MTKSKGPELVSSLWAMTAISLAFLSLRFFCKGVYSRQLRVDDAILLFAWVLTLIYSALITVAVGYGLGKRGAEIDPGDQITMTKFMFIGELFTILSIPISKTSFAITLYRLVSQRWQKLFIIFVIVTMNAAMWLTAVLLFLQCKPIAKNWDRDLDGSCWKSEVQDRYAVFSGFYSAVLDILLATFPALIIWQLQINMKEKIGVIVCMSLGFLAGIAAAIKTSYLPGLGNFTDMSYQISELLIWSNAETAVTILAASIPFFRVLLKNITSHRSQQTYHRSYRLGSYTKGSNIRRSLRPLPVTEMVHNDDMSDRSMLDGVLPIQGIVKSEEVRIEYSGKNGSSA